MTEHGALKQTMYPDLSVLVVAAVSYLGYFGSRSVSSESIHQLMAIKFANSTGLLLPVEPPPSR